MKNRIAELRQRIHGLRAKSDQVRGDFFASGRAAFTEAETSMLNDFAKKIKAAEIDLEDAEDARDRELSATPARRLTRFPGEDHDGFERGRADTDARGQIILPGARRSYSAMFGEPAAASIDIQEFMSAIHAGTWRPEVEAAIGVEGVGSEGGYLVPGEFAAQMLDLSLEKEIVRPRARIEPMISNTKEVAGFDLTSHQSSIGGFVVSWVGEATEMTPQKPMLRAINLKTRKASILAECSNELIADGGMTFENMMLQTIVDGIGFGLDESFLSGPGTAKPLGALNDPACITVAKESGQANDTIVWENLVKMFARLHPALIKGAVWVANVNCIPQLLMLKQLIKNVAGTDNVGGSWIPIQIDGDGNMTILTIPVIFTEKLPVLGDAGDIILANFSQYVIGMRKELTLDKSHHVGFTRDTSHYRVIVRVDGQGSWKAPVTPRNGADTLSWVVQLGAR